jgi:hypothetical protein
MMSGESSFDGNSNGGENGDSSSISNAIDATTSVPIVNVVETPLFEVSLTEVDVMIPDREVAESTAKDLETPSAIVIEDGGKIGTGLDTEVAAKAMSPNQGEGNGANNNNNLEMRKPRTNYGYKSNYKGGSGGGGKYKKNYSNNSYSSTNNSSSSPAAIGLGESVLDKIASTVQVEVQPGTPSEDGTTVPIGKWFFLFSFSYFCSSCSSCYSSSSFSCSCSCSSCSSSSSH